MGFEEHPFYSCEVLRKREFYFCRARSRGSETASRFDAVTL